MDFFISYCAEKMQKNAFVQKFNKVNPIFL